MMNDKTLIAPLTTGETASHENPLTRGLDILLVDDDEICLFIHERVLQLSGMCRSIHSACNGLAALEYLSGAAERAAPVPDIIFLDLQMPLMDGIAFLETFKSLKLASKERIAIVLLSSSVSEKEIGSALSLGVKHCLAKPFSSEALQSVANALYNRH